MHGRWSLFSHRRTLKQCCYFRASLGEMHGFRARGPQIQFFQTFTSTATGSQFTGKPSMQIQIIKALNSGDRKKASDLLLDFGSKTHSLTANDFVDIFKYCEHSSDPLFVMEMWRFMELKGVSMNNICSSLMMQTLCKGGYLEEAFDVADYLGGSQCLYPVLSLYNSLLGYCTKMQNIPASKCLESMEKKMVGKSEVTYMKLLEVSSELGELTGSRETILMVYDTMRTTMRLGLLSGPQLRALSQAMIVAV
ncbi:hypothetical protein VNO78_16583 [Psophocarpus tetragonolobus]|uniref:Pentatricopeptide repeat-containing protein n=1 Tax=Psophocarpus tetragonolobus TaxID=3891 RepID=A0AAN9XKW3_PSOTE